MKRISFLICFIIAGLMFFTSSCSNSLDLTVKPTLFEQVSDVEINVDQSKVVRFFGGEDGIYKIVPDTSDIVDLVIEGNKIKFIGKQEGKQHFEVYANNQKIDFDVIVNQQLPLGVIVLDSTLTSWPPSAVPLDSIVRIPLSVKYIGDNAMRSHEDGPMTNVIYNNLKEVYIPNSVVSIGNNAFSYRVSEHSGYYSSIDNVYDSLPLNKVHIGDNVKTIGDYAFVGHLKLRDIVLPKGLTKIGRYAFGRNAIESIKVPELVTKLEDGVFYNCDNLKSVELLGNITSIGAETFYRCGALPSITIPNTVESIGNSAFYYCTSLPAVTLPNTVESVGDNAFYNCTSLSSITLSSSLKSLGDGVFYNCKSLPAITLPKSLESIGQAAFCMCPLITNMEIPNKVKVLGNKTFCGCLNLVNITMPESLDSLGVGVFAGCSKLTNLVLPNSLEKIGMAAFAGCSSLTSIKIPEGVKTIGTGAFANCANLTTVELPSTIKSLTGGQYLYWSSGHAYDEALSFVGEDGGLFGDCPKLTKIICRAVEPFQINIGSVYVDRIGEPRYYSKYIGELKNITLYVPAGSVEAYKQMMRDVNAGAPEQYQNNFADILPIPEGE